MHPVNKHNFGVQGIAVKFFNGTATVTGYIIKQLGSKRYAVTADGINIFITHLVSTAAQATSLGNKQMTILAGAQYVSKLFDSTAQIVDNGPHIPWSLGTSVNGAAVIQTFAQIEQPTNTVAEPNQSITHLAAFSFALSSSSFTDPLSEPLTYTATLTGGAALPTWLAFNATTKTFSGTAPALGNGPYSVTVTATDTLGMSAGEIFSITVA